MSRLTDIRDELKQIRNSVEELQFDSDNTRRRQRDLYQDVDRRLLEIERNQRAINFRLEEVTITQGTPAVEAASGELEEDWSAVNASLPEDAAPDSAPPVADELAGDDSGSQDADASPMDTPADTVAPDADPLPTADRPATVSLEEQNAYDKAFALLKQDRYQDFFLAARRFVTTWPTSQLADDIWYWIAEARYVNREFEDALDDFKTVVVSYPDSERVPDALLKMGYIQYDIGAYERAAETFRDILARFPGHNVAVPAKARLRRIEKTIQ